jgi:hypothetical protein
MDFVEQEWRISFKVKKKVKKEGNSRRIVTVFEEVWNFSDVMS